MVVQKKAPGKGLSERQMRLPFFQAAHDRLTRCLELRDEQLQRLAQRSPHGRRTRAELYKTLKAVAVPMLKRLDLATGALGWVDSSGNLHFASQKSLAQEAQISQSTLNRFFARLEELGYCVRRIERVSKPVGELLWRVRTRVCIVFTPLFFRDLCMGLLWTRTRKWAVKKRKRQQETANTERQQRATAQLVKREKAKQSFNSWRQIKSHLLQEQRREQVEKEVIKAYTTQPGMTPAEAHELRRRLLQEQGLADT